MLDLVIESWEYLHIHENFERKQISVDVYGNDDDAENNTEIVSSSLRNLQSIDGNSNEG